MPTISFWICSSKFISWSLRPRFSRKKWLKMRRTLVLEVCLMMTSIHSSISICSGPSTVKCALTSNRRNFTLTTSAASTTPSSSPSKSNSNPTKIKSESQRRCSKFTSKDTKKPPKNCTIHLIRPQRTLKKWSRPWKVSKNAGILSIRKSTTIIRWPWPETVRSKRKSRRDTNKTVSSMRNLLKLKRPMLRHWIRRWTNSDKTTWIWLNFNRVSLRQTSSPRKSRKVESITRFWHLRRTFSRHRKSRC